MVRLLLEAGAGPHCAVSEVFMLIPAEGTEDDLDANHGLA